MRLFRKSRQQDLAVTMAGVKLGDRVLVAGCGDPRLIAGLAIKSGLTGRACAVDDSEARTADAARRTAAEGALVETITAPLSALPFESASFDIVVLRDVLDLGVAQEAWRLLRPGGRCLVVHARPRGVAALLRARPSRAVDVETATRALRDAQFRGVRTLAEREGTVFVEGVKASSSLSSR